MRDHRKQFLTNLVDAVDMIPRLTLNIPNIVTAVRILLVPVFVILLVNHQLFDALVIFTMAGISDGLDGFIARCFNQRTEVGAYLDPIADKLLIISAFISLAILKIIPAWLSVIVISRDILILLGVSLCSFANIKIHIRPSFVSKCTTLAQLSTIFLSLYHHVQTDGFFPRYSSFLYAITAILTIISGLHYGYNGLKLFQESSRVNGYEK